MEKRIHTGQVRRVNGCRVLVTEYHAGYGSWSVLVCRPDGSVADAYTRNLRTFYFPIAWK